MIDRDDRGDDNGGSGDTDNDGDDDDDNGDGFYILDISKMILTWNSNHPTVVIYTY